MACPPTHTHTDTHDTCCQSLRPTLLLKDFTFFLSQRLEKRKVFTSLNLASLTLNLNTAQHKGVDEGPKRISCL